MNDIIINILGFASIAVFIVFMWKDTEVHHKATPRK